MTSSPERSVEDTLGRLIEHGYLFVHPRDAHGEIVAVIGIRVHNTVIDVIRLEAEDDVTATRMPGDEDDVLDPHTVLWCSSGVVDTVVDDLLSLPDDAYAAQSSSAATGCWVSGARGRAKWLAATA